MSEFFARRAPDRPGLALFLNAGDPPLPVLADIMRMLDDCRVDCLELAVPFPDSVTDGEVNRRSAQRALGQGVGLDEVLDFLAAIRPGLRHLRVALLADWSHTVKPLPLADFTARVAASGADGLLVHGLPPRLRTGCRDAARDAGLPLVTTCYPSSAEEVKAEAAEHATAYLYLVAHYGRSGGTPSVDRRQLADTIAMLRRRSTAPIAVGFGIRSRTDIAAVHALGADAAIVGSAGVARIEEALAQQADVVDEFHTFVTTLLPPSPTRSGVSPHDCPTS
ncbi:tryptophan synthase subunit alpha [Streptomyces sp. NBC_00237]|uniref:tryptophan synthase subunit alpha n=1 Tax=Streptomyces sp. NBC_00237 TaxID=2975687 RepID=UPI002251F9E6|nr:tryptophan synthase subunit alpha [Streptomyces sp. NBC_00237]MCX5202715.1 tryptophan synthase subunit alpha [Streptomyces sp. NBC_00237]